MLRPASLLPAALAGLLGIAPPATAHPPELPRADGVELLGEVSFPTGLHVDGQEVGGLSGLACADGGARCVAVADDRGRSGPPRFFRLSIDLGDGRLDPGDVTFHSAVVLRTPEGGEFPEGLADPEGIVLSPEGDLLVSSEGDPRIGVAPWVRRFGPDGRHLGELPLPAAYVPVVEEERGVRVNLALESLTGVPDSTLLYTATESTLAQDGPAADLGRAAAARILGYDLATGDVAREHLYWVDAVVDSTGDDRFRVSGLVELLALDADTLLALERAYIPGLGFRIRLYRASLEGADDLAGRPAPEGLDLASIRPAGKRLLAELGQLGVEADNVEGLTFGPRLADGRRSLLLVSDNNFSPLQRTQFLALALDEPPADPPEPLVEPAIHLIQGRGHRSPLDGRRVARVPGVVTAVRLAEGRRGFWIESQTPDDDPATSEGIFVDTEPREPGVVPGDRVRVTGWVEERPRPAPGSGAEAGGLPVTMLTRAVVAIEASGVALPGPTRLGPGGRTLPATVIEDDGLARFEPTTDGLDLFESLEGMRVAVADPVVVGPTTRWGEVVVLAAGGRGVERRTAAGGLRLAADDPNPERIPVAAELAPLPAVDVGDRLAGDVVGVLDYARGSYRLLPTAPVLGVAADAREPRATSLRGDAEHLTVATWNVWNLAATDPAGRFAEIGRTIVHRLGAPDVVALQEVQDDSGRRDDGTVTAGRTLELLVEAVAAAGGPRYRAWQVDPEDGRDGGAPGGNIRVAFLVDPERVRVEPRGAPGPRRAVEVTGGAEGPRLEPNPGRVAPQADAWAASPVLPWGAARKPLALEATFRGHRLFLVDAHLSSKGDDDRLYGARQPPLKLSEVQRRDQAAALHAFVAELLAADPGAAVVVLGDLNDFEWSVSLDRLAGELLAAPLLGIPAEERYSFVYRGNSQLLDHVLVSHGLAERLAGVEIVHGAADRADRAKTSDHDPVVARFRLP